MNDSDAHWIAFLGSIAIHEAGYFNENGFVGKESTLMRPGAVDTLAEAFTAASSAPATSPPSTTWPWPAVPSPRCGPSTTWCRSSTIGSGGVAATGPLREDAAMSDAPASPFAPDLFAGQVVFVTGGATGIGKEICRSFGHHGARSIASRKQEVLEAAKAELEAEGIDVWFDTCDVRDAGAAQRVVDGLVAHYGQLDVVVNKRRATSPR